MLTKLKKRLSDETAVILAVFFPTLAESACTYLLPILLGILRSNVDKFILSSISFSTTILTFVSTFYSCIAASVAIMMSHLFGANNRRGMINLFRTSMLFGILVSLLSAIPLLFFSEPLLRAIYPTLSDNFIDTAKIYMIFSALSMPLVYIQTNASGIMRSCLNSKGPYALSLLTGVINLILNFVLLIVFDFGIYGLCISLLISRISGVFISYVILKKMSFFPTRKSEEEKEERKPIFFPITNQILKLSYVVILQSLLSAVSSIIITRYISQMDELFILARPIYNNIIQITYIPTLALSYVAQSFSGKYKGAGEELNSIKITLKLTYACILILAVISLVLYPLAPLVVSFYTKYAAIAELAVKYLRILLIASPLFYGAYNVLPAGIRGLGHVKFPAIVFIIITWAVQMPLIQLFCLDNKNSSTNFVLITVFLWILQSIIFYVDILLKKHSILKKQKATVPKYGSA